MEPVAKKKKTLKKFNYRCYKEERITFPVQ